MNDDKYKSRSTWKSGGVNRWRQAKVRMKEHCCSESHMIGMTRWNKYNIKPLDMAFAVADSWMQAAKERERQNNREIIFRLIKITLYLARQGLAFRGRDERGVPFSSLEQ